MRRPGSPPARRWPDRAVCKKVCENPEIGVAAAARPSLRFGRTPGRTQDEFACRAARRDAVRGDGACPRAEGRAVPAGLSRARGSRPPRPAHRHPHRGDLRIGRALLYPRRHRPLRRPCPDDPRPRGGGRRDRGGVGRHGLRRGRPRLHGARHPRSAKPRHPARTVQPRSGRALLGHAACAWRPATQRGAPGRLHLPAARRASPSPQAPWSSRWPWASMP
jgi:hypothetical protein